jgi:hypothetical protein
MHRNRAKEGKVSLSHQVWTIAIANRLVDRFRSKWIDGLRRRRPNGSQNYHDSENDSLQNRPLQISSAPRKTQKSAEHYSNASPASTNTRQENVLHNKTLVPASSAKMLDSTVSLTNSLIPAPASSDLTEFWDAIPSSFFESSHSTIPPYISQLPTSLLEEDSLYLHTKGALTVPVTPLRDALLQCFVEYVYPFLPLINLEELLSIVQQGDGENGHISLLVFQAVMLAGAGFIDMRYLKSAGYQTRREALRTLFQKVKVRFDLG